MSTTVADGWKMKPEDFQASEPYKGLQPYEEENKIRVNYDETESKLK